MNDINREFIINNLLMPDFIEHKGSEMHLEEAEETGKSELTVRLESGNNLLIANVDKKKTDIQFFQADKTKSLYKRVDHMIFERRDDATWKLHLIEMKSSVGERKWGEIKGKFRASYLLAHAIAGMLRMEISETVMYTTYERVMFEPLNTMPSARRSRLGMPLVKMEDEWTGKQFRLNFGEQISFMHIPIKMVRNEERVLTGSM